MYLCVCVSDIGNESLARQSTINLTVTHEILIKKKIKKKILQTKKKHTKLNSVLSI